MADTPLSMPRYPGQPPTHAPGSPSGASSDEPTGAIEIPQSRFSKGVKTTGLGLSRHLQPLFFTITKLPDDRIQSYVQGNLSTLLASRGITLTIGESKINYLFGISYIMKDVTFNLPPPAQPAHVDSIEVSPTLLPLLTGKIGAKIVLKNSNGEMTLTGGFRGSSISGSIDAQQFDIGKIGLLKIAADVTGSAVISGKADFSTSTEDMTATDATIDLDLRKIVIDSQSIQGFTIPRLAMSDGKVDIDIDHGKGQVKTLRIGRADSATDDIKANLTGEVLFGKTLQNSTINIKAVFSLSDSLMKSFALLDAILAAGKLPGGGYAYKLQGPVLSPNPIPAGGS